MRGLVENFAKRVTAQKKRKKEEVSKRELKVSIVGAHFSE